MGLKPRFDEYEAGVVCPHCEIDLFFDITPKYVELTLTGLMGCPGPWPPPPNGTWLLTQVQPCIWTYRCFPYNFEWNLQADRSFLRVFAAPQEVFFYSLVMQTCRDWFLNENDQCEFWIQSIGGVGIIRWGPSIGPQSSFEQWEVGDSCCICESRIFSGFTPKYAFAKVLGLKKCPFGVLEPPEGEFDMTQVAPCVWQGVHGNFTFVWSLTNDKSTFLIHDNVGNRHFFHERDEPCKAFFANQLWCFPLTDHAYDGGCRIRWGPWGPRQE